MTKPDSNVWAREPDQEILLELGRLIWLVVNLEDRAQSLIKQIGGVNDQLPLSEQITKTLIRLDSFEDNEVIRSVREWLISIQRFLPIRNALLHGEPMSMMVKTPQPMIGEMAWKNGDDFVRLRTRGGDVVEVDLTVTKLEELNHSIIECGLKWMPLAVEFGKQVEK